MVVVLRSCEGIQCLVGGCACGAAPAVRAVLCVRCCTSSCTSDAGMSVGQEGEEGEAWLNSWMRGFMADFRHNFDVEDRRSSNGGGHKKHAKYDAEEKAEWIRVVERLEARGDSSPIATALRLDGTLPTRPGRYGRHIPNPKYDAMMSNISTWRKEPLRSEILQQAAVSRSDRRALIRPTGSAALHHPEMEKQLKREVVQKRQKRRRVSTLWLQVRAKQLIREYPAWAHGREFVASIGWRQAFMRRAGFSLRQQTNSKKHSVIERRGMLLTWHRRLRQHLQEGPQQCDTYGRYDRHHRWNVDQVPLPFVIDKDATVEVRGAVAVQIKGPGEALSKRQATLQVCFRGCGEQPVLAIIFRGKVRKHHNNPMNMTEDELAELRAIPGIHWYFQVHVSFVVLVCRCVQILTVRAVYYYCHRKRLGRMLSSQELGCAKR